MNHSMIFSRSMTGFRSTALSLLSLFAVSSATIHAATEEVTLKLNKKKFEHGKTLSVGSPKKTIFPSKLYDYTISGTIRGNKGDLGKLFPNEVPLDVFLNGFKAGSSSILSDSLPNPDGALPATLLTKSFSGGKNLKGVGRVSLKLLLTVEIEANGLVRLKASQVRIKIDGKKATGFIVFGQTSTLVVSTAPIVEFKSLVQNVDENAGTVDVIVWKQGNQDKPAAINYTTTQGDALEGEDYTLTTGTLSFAANEIEKTITVPIVDDAVQEVFENFTIDLVPIPDNGTVPGDKSSMTIGIKNDD